MSHQRLGQVNSQTGSLVPYGPCCRIEYRLLALEVSVGETTKSGDDR